MPVFFNGRLIISPATASVINDDAMLNKNLTVGNIAAFIGKSGGGQPNKALIFGSPQKARDVLRSGELLDAVIKAFDPSAQTPAPSTVVALRVNPAQQSSLVLLNAASASVITLKSVNYGQQDNTIKVKVEAGTTVGKRVTIQQGSSIYAGDNLARNAFSALYAGTGTGTIAIDATKVTVVANAVTTDILFADFTTIGAVVDRLNVIAGVTAIVLGDNQERASADGLDFLAAADFKTAALTLTANLQAIIDWVNSGSNPFVVATRSAAVGTVPANIGFTYLTGGTEGTTTNTEWAAGFTELQKTNYQWLCPISGDAAIHAMADAHVAYCSNILAKERRAICGMASASSDAAAIAAAKAINSDRTSLVHIGHYEYNLAGALVLRPPYMTAAIIAAMFSGVNPGTPLTNKTMKVRGLERDLINPTDTDVLLPAGVLCVENTEQGYKVVQSISTWLTNSKYTKREQSTGNALDFTVRNVREAVDVLRGEKGNPVLLARTVSIAQTALTELARPEPQGPGVLAGDAENPPFRNITATLEGDVTRLEFECSPVIPNNYILVTVYAVPFSGAASA